MKNSIIKLINWSIVSPKNYVTRIQENFVFFFSHIVFAFHLSFLILVWELTTPDNEQVEYGFIIIYLAFKSNLKFNKNLWGSFAAYDYPHNYWFQLHRLQRRMCQYWKGLAGLSIFTGPTSGTTCKSTSADLPRNGEDGPRERRHYSNSH